MKKSLARQPPSRSHPRILERQRVARDSPRLAQPEKRDKADALEKIGDVDSFTVGFDPTRERDLALYARTSRIP